MTGDTRRAGGGNGPRHHAVLSTGDHRPFAITPRDLDVLTWVARHGIVTTEQIARQFFPTPSGIVSARRRIRLLCHATPPFLQRDRTFWEEPAVVRVTKPGADLAGVDLRPARLVLAEVHHALGVVDLAEQLAAAHQGSTLITEREWRAQRYRARVTGGRIPDALLWTSNTGSGGGDDLAAIVGGSAKGRLVAIELDRTGKREKVEKAMIRAYQATPVVAVWWYVSPRRVQHVREFVRLQRADDFIEVRAWHP